MRDYIPCFAPIFGSAERIAASNHFLNDRFITSGPHVQRFEERFAKHIGRKHGVMTQSGSTALWAAVTAMDWHKGAKILTPAVTFPTSVTPLLQAGLIPVFADVELGTYNIAPDVAWDTSKKAGGIDGVLVPHTLGNPVDPSLWSGGLNSVEDSCDAFGSEIGGKNCGTFGTISTFSFYPAHNITTGEGGLAVTDNHQLANKITRLCSWGRDCYCKPGFDDSCGNRFGYSIDGIPYDHKYVFSEPYASNIKPLDVQGVIGNVQLDQEHIFTKRRKDNFDVVNWYLGDLGDLIHLPRSLTGADPAWFGYPVTLKKGDRRQICLSLERKGIATRLLFAGNITRHPLFKGQSHIIPFPLKNSDIVMEHTFILPCNHSLTEEEAHYVGKTAREEITACV